MVQLRLAALSDWARLYAWRNDALTRSMFKHSEPVSLAEHMAWLTETLEKPYVRLFVATVGDKPIGTVRLDRDRHEPRYDGWAEVSLTVEPRSRGVGYAERIVGRVVADNTWSACSYLSGLLAEVKPENLASLRAFAACGFLPVSFGEFVVLERKF